MSSYIITRLPGRLRLSALPPITPRTFQATATYISRSYATTTKGDAANASNVGDNPQASSAEASHVNASRATDGASNPDSASVASPVSQGNLQSAGEKSHDSDPVKQDPKKPAEEKAKHTEAQGQRSMGPEDNQ